MAQPPNLRVVSSATSETASGSYTPTGVLNERGQQYYAVGGIPPATGGGGGQPPPLDHSVAIAKLQKTTDLLEKIVAGICALGIVAIASSYLLLAGMIDDKYDKVGEKLDALANQVVDLRLGLAKNEAEKSIGKAAEAQKIPANDSKTPVK